MKNIPTIPLVPGHAETYLPITPMVPGSPRSQSLLTVPHAISEAELESFRQKDRRRASAQTQYSYLIELALHVKQLTQNQHLQLPNGDRFDRDNVRQHFKNWKNTFSDVVNVHMARLFENNLENAMNPLVEPFDDRTGELFNSLKYQRY